MTFTLRPRHYEPDATGDPASWPWVTSGAEESSGEASARTGVREQTLRAAARGLGFNLDKGQGGIAATLPSSSWDRAARRAKEGKRTGGPPKGFRDAMLAPGLESCATAARRTGKRSESLRENAIALGWATRDGLTPAQWDMAAARIQERARSAA